MIEGRKEEKREAGRRETWNTRGRFVGAWEEEGWEEYTQNSRGFYNIIANFIQDGRSCCNCDGRHVYYLFLELVFYFLFSNSILRCT